MAIEHEKAVIACVLINEDSIRSVYSSLQGAMFISETLANIYMVQQAMFMSGRKITVDAVAMYCETDVKNVEQIKGIIRECMSEVVTSSEITANAEIIIQEYKAREFNKLLENTPKALPVEADNAITQFESNLENLKTGKETIAKSMSDVVRELKNKYFVEKTGKQIQTGFSGIDECMGNLEGGEVIVIGARPAVGKSAFVTQVLTNMAEQGLKVGFFNLEMSEKQVYERIIARFSGISLGRIQRAVDYQPEEERLFDNGNDKLEKLKNLYLICGSKHLSDIRIESRFQKFDVIVIDYLQLVRPDRQFSNRASEVGEISKSLKSLAMDLNIPVIALSQMNREHDEDVEPDIADLRESGDIEQDASIICLMWNITEEVKGFKIGKNRQGKLFNGALKFDGNTMTFKECEKPVKNKDGFKKAKDGEIPSFENL